MKILTPDSGFFWAAFLTSPQRHLDASASSQRLCVLSSHSPDPL